MTKKAERALVVFFILISIYISLRFEWKMALAAIIAVIHDILVTVGVYSISGFSVTPATIVAFLTSRSLPTPSGFGGPARCGMARALPCFFEVRGPGW